jgi:tyrosyl-tRNA synthetase
MLSREEIEAAIAGHAEAPHLRQLQRLLAKEITIMVHGEEEYGKAVAASEMLFGNATSEALKKLDEKTFLQVFDGVPTFEVEASRLPLNILDLLAVETSVFPSKGECRKMVQSNGVSIDKEKVSDINAMIGEESVLNGKYILAQKGKKNYFIIRLK